MNEAAIVVDATLLAPISAGAPAGRDLTYDASLEAIAAEIEKATALAGELPDWQLVAGESARLLRESTKDLRIASWWVVAVARTDGWQATAQALATYSALTEQFWADLHPPLKRLRARAALVGWLGDNLAKALAARAVEGGDAAVVTAVAEGVARLDATMAERFGDAHPGLGPLRSVLREKLRALPAPEAPKPAAPPPPTAPVAPPAAAPPPQPATVSATPAEAPAPAPAPQPADAATAPATNLEEAQTAAARLRVPLGAYARTGRLTAPASPWPYRLARVSAWLNIETAPQVEGGKTFLRGPRPPDRAALARLFEGASWDALREASEAALSEHIFWLDLHRYTAVALERLGPAYAAARAAVVRETAGLLERVPALPALLFSNGTPLASPETVEWLAQNAAAGGAAPQSFGGAGAGAAGAAGSTGDADAALAALDECAARVRAGQVEEGLTDALTLTHGIAAASTRFRARLRVAQLAHGAARDAIAAALLDALMADINPTLEAWEPLLCGEVIETVLRASGAVKKDDPRHGLLFQRLLALNPAAALRLGR